MITCMIKNTYRFRYALVVVTLLLFAAVTSAYAANNPRNCLEIKYLNSSASDGDYLIEPMKGKAFNVYCADMNTEPKEYLSLVNTGGDYNFSQATAGGARPGTDVRTNFTKLRIDPLTFLVDIDDATFSTTTGACTDCMSPMVYGYAADCLSMGSSAGVANIDLTGTPFTVNDEFNAGGYVAAGSVTFNSQTYYLSWNDAVMVNSQVVDITGGGYCGGVRTGYPPFHNIMQLKWAAL